MTPRGFSAILWVLALSAACASDEGDGAHTGAPAAEADVLAEVRQYYEDFSARDWEAFADHFWPGATLVTIWQPPGEPEPRVVSTSVPDFVAQAPLGPGSRAIFGERMTSSRVWVHANLAQVWAEYTARFGDSGSVVTWEGIDAFTLVRHGGRWRISSLSYADQ